MQKGSKVFIFFGVFFQKKAAKLPCPHIYMGDVIVCFIRTTLGALTKFSFILKAQYKFK
jgi:hypothetical protein